MLPFMWQLELMFRSEDSEILSIHVANNPAGPVLTLVFTLAKLKQFNIPDPQPPKPVHS